MDFKKFLKKVKKDSQERIQKIHRLAKKMWGKRKWTPMDIRNKCLETWDYLEDEIGTKIKPLISMPESSPPRNLIFGSGSFSTGKFQIEQYRTVQTYTKKCPVYLSGLVTNKSMDHNCRGRQVAEYYNIPFVEFDFIDWYHEYIDPKESNPIRASRYWYSEEDHNRPSFGDIATRFKIRQNQYHKAMGEKIEDKFNQIDIVSARGYNFQFCRNIFIHQRNHLPHVNDTHPADLRYIDPDTHEKLYAGWQANAVEMMIDDEIHDTYHGSLIEVNFMDRIDQINDLDEGALLALSKGITPDPDLERSLTAKEIQNALKIMDDYFFCTLEPTGLILMWGITEDPLPVKYRIKTGENITISQPAIVVGNEICAGNQAWGLDLDSDLDKLVNFLFP